MRAVWVGSLTLSAAGFLKAVWGFAAIILIAAPLFAATDFVGDRLKLEWRSWLTQNILSAYYANRSFYKLHGCGEALDNPDQVEFLPPCEGQAMLYCSAQPAPRTPTCLSKTLLLYSVLNFSVDLYLLS